LTELFGQQIDPNFDLAKEQRQDRVGWALLAATGCSILYELLGGPVGTLVFQGCLATVLFYGANFYANRRNSLRELWLRKTIVASVPLHIVYLAALFWSDKLIPGTMSKPLVFMPIIGVGFAVESILFDKIADHFKSQSGTR
jgi:hypothetical protein